MHGISAGVSRRQFEARGEGATIPALASGACRKAAADPVVLAEPIRLVAGTGFEPVTFRL